MYYTYIIKSVGNKNFIYKGITTDIDRRFTQHNLGKVKSTKHFRPFNLMHVEITKDRLEARKLEKFFKSGYGREVLQEIMNIG